MYDFEALRPAHDRLWAEIAANLRSATSIPVPDELTRSASLMKLWRDPHLLLGQTCGYPYVTALRGQVRLVLTPVYDAPGCDGAWHRSALIVHRDDDAADLTAMRGRRCVMNAWDSNTGMNLLRATLAPLAQGQAFFSEVSISGSHHQSLARVAAGAADIAAIDCVTLAHLTQIDPDLVARTRILGWTPPSPGLPMITAGSRDDATVAALRAAVAAVFSDPALAATRRTLLLRGYEVLTDWAYAEIAGMEAAADDWGYSVVV
jgi:ABC-type phosphate/phosphonate transport system substrate-binding protein